MAKGTLLLSLIGVVSEGNGGSKSEISLFGGTNYIFSIVGTSN